MAQKQDSENIIPFYSNKSPFSQFYPCEFNGIVGKDHLKFNCTEQYMMYRKAITFNDKVTAGLIMKERKPSKIKKLGRDVKSFKDKKWDEVAEHIVYQGNLLKFSQNPKLLKELLITGDAILVEASARDRKWGVGLALNNPKIFDKSKWRGKNLLGSILMHVRSELAKKWREEHPKPVN